MDLATRLYLAYGSSTKSERNASDKAMVMLAGMGVDVKSIRLDRYYSFPTYVDKFDGSCKVYVLAKKNSTLNGSQKWKDTINKGY